MSPTPKLSPDVPAELWQGVPPCRAWENRRRFALWSAEFERRTGRPKVAAAWEAIADDLDSYDWEPWLAGP